MQAEKEHITVSKRVKRELEHQKLIICKKMGRKVSFDFVIRNIMGWS
jgi:hypothetical protein